MTIFGVGTHPFGYTYVMFFSGRWPGHTSGGHYHEVSTPRIFFNGGDFSFVFFVRRGTTYGRVGRRVFVVTRQRGTFNV